MLPLLVAVVAAALAGAVAYLRGPAAARRGPDAQAELERAVAAVDRELAADLELTTMFDQTKQAFVLENGQFLAARDAVARHAPEACAILAELYERIPAVESAMERRGPAGSIANADRTLVEAWEGDAREAQRVIRAALAQPTATRWDRLAARLRQRFAGPPPGA